MYRNNEGVTRDYVEAVKWFRKAAEQGVARAQFKLGVMYERGDGVTQDYVDALMWYSISVVNGNAGAAKRRDIVAEKLTAEQLEKTNKRVRRCKESDYKDCDAKAKSWWQKLIG